VKILIAIAAGWIVFYAADMVLFGSHYSEGLGRLATAFLNNLGIFF
jgi:hypothetical protein